MTGRSIFFSVMIQVNIYNEVPHHRAMVYRPLIVRNSKFSLHISITKMELLGIESNLFL